MKAHNLFLISVSVLVLAACKQTTTNHPIFDYYPPASVFEKGYASKFYEHYYPHNTSSDASTRIRYSRYQKLTDTTFTVENYNAGFWLTGKSYYHVEGDELYLDSSVNIWQSDTTVLDIKKGLHSKWNQRVLDEAHFLTTSHTDAYSSTFQSQQLAVKDSIINGLPAKVFSEKNQRTTIQGDTTEYHWKNTFYYVEGLGFFGQVAKGEDYNWEVELVEQMPLSRFQSLANHDKKRVAYIDPEETLDRESNFNICGHEKFIADYYNSTPDGDYKYGKAALSDTIFSNLDEAKLLNQTGMLTFRFVVNCEGKAGRFIAEGYDLMYQPYDFPRETIDHLYGLMKKLEEWRVVVIREEPRDAYFYFTFKLTNGKITDILP